MSYVPMSRLSWGEMQEFLLSERKVGVAGGSWGGSSHLSPAQPPGAEDQTVMGFLIVLHELWRQMPSEDVPPPLWLWWAVALKGTREETRFMTK